MGVVLPHSETVSRGLLEAWYDTLERVFKLSYWIGTFTTINIWNKQFSNLRLYQPLEVLGGCSSNPFLVGTKHEAEQNLQCTALSTRLLCMPCSGTMSCPCPQDKNSPKLYSSYRVAVGYWCASCRGSWDIEKGLCVSFVLTCRPWSEYHKRGVLGLTQTGLSITVPVCHCPEVVPQGLLQVIPQRCTCATIPPPGSIQCNILAEWGKWDQQAVMVINLILHIWCVAIAS